MKAGEQKLIRNSLFLITIELISKLLGLILFALAARFLGVKELGLYAFAVAVANFFMIIPRFGFERLVQKEVGCDPSLFYPYFTQISVVKAALSLGMLVLLSLLLYIRGGDESLTVLLVACCSLLYSFLEFTTAFFRALQKPELEVAVRAFFSVANLLLGAIVLYAGGRLTGFVVTQMVSVGAALLLGVVIVERTTVKVRSGLDRQVLWGHIVAAAPFAGVLVALYCSHQITTVLLAAFTGKAEVGYFAAASKVFDNLMIIPAAIMGVFLPTMSQLYGTSVGRFVRTLHLTLKYLFILSAPLVVGTALLAQPLTVFLYGQPFAPSTPALQVLNTALLFGFWNCAGDSVLIARNRDWLLLGSTWVGAVIHVSASFLLIPAFSYLGASLAVLVTQLCRFLLLFSCLRRYLSARTLLQITAAPTCCTLLMGAVVLVLQRWSLAVVIPVSMGVYCITLVASGAVGGRETDHLQGMMRSRFAPSLPEP